MHPDALTVHGCIHLAQVKQINGEEQFILKIQIIPKQFASKISHIVMCPGTGK